MKVGIDLGTTYSLISHMGPNGFPVLLPDQSVQDVFYTPSIVHINSEFAFVGQMVETLLQQQPDLKLINFFKRHLGENKPIYYDDNGQAWYPETVAALMLKKLRFDAESFTANEVSEAVITVPAHFSDPQRKAVLTAAMLADVSVLGLVEEPVAAALHAGVINQGKDQILMVYDFGGGTFDASVISIDANGIYVLSKDGLTDLGGKELDEKVAEIILFQFEKALGTLPTLNAKTLLELRRTSEEIKVELCMPGKSQVRKVVLLGGHAVEIYIHAKAFEQAIADALDKTQAVALRCLEKSGLQVDDVDVLLLVGGSSMVPAVQKQMERIFCKPGQKVLFHEPTKAVTYGATLHAYQISGDAERYQLPPEFRGVTGYSVGVRTIDPQTGRTKIDPLIKGNMPLPTSAHKTYYTTRSNQQRMVLDLVQYRDPTEEVVGLGQLVVGPLPSPKINYPIDVSVEYQTDGTVSVRAFDPQTGVELNQNFGRKEQVELSNLTTQRALVRATLINTM